jgi:biopolymer transport protein ExbD
MRFRRRKATDDDMPEANVLPVMNVMFLLIPALLLAMETASMAAIAVQAPRSSPLPSKNTTTEPDKPSLKVQINSDGIILEASEQRLEPITAIIESDGTTKHDFAALEAKASVLKMQYAGDPKVRISAELDVEYADLIAAMDALRGTNCKIGARGEEPSADCYFWAPTIDSY